MTTQNMNSFLIGKGGVYLVQRLETLRQSNRILSHVYRLVFPRE